MRASRSLGTEPGAPGTACANAAVIELFPTGTFTGCRVDCVAEEVADSVEICDGDCGTIFAVDFDSAVESEPDDERPSTTEARSERNESVTTCVATVCSLRAGDTFTGVPVSKFVPESSFVCSTFPEAPCSCASIACNVARSRCALVPGGPVSGGPADCGGGFMPSISAA